MSNIIGKPERETQNRVINLFKEELSYSYLGDWTGRENNSNIEGGLLTNYLKSAGYRPEQISRALEALRREADNHSRSLYENNRAVYGLLRYGVQARTEPGKPTETIKVIDWATPENNYFAVAEEVTLHGHHGRRPDIVLYVNGIAIGVLELKSSRKSVGDGIRQNLSNQQPEFNSWFFSTVQFVFAGNDSEGLRYGTIGTPEKYFLQWKEDEEDNSRFKLDKYLLKMCDKKRIIELMCNFIVFDDGVKMLPRVHQYFGVKAAQEHIRQRKGGIIWHTQGSGKSIVMVLLAKWILENNPKARVAIITDRDELDKQIKDVFRDAGEGIVKADSSRNLMNLLGKASPRLLCALIHKFGQRDIKDFEQYIKDLKQQPVKTVGEMFVFVDECHRTQSDKFHKLMKAKLPNAVFIGFTGTPLLRKDKETSVEVFGGYIHIYKFSEAIEDGVILDLSYEARDIDQVLDSQERIDDWFDAKTAGLNSWQKDELKKRWGTMQKVLSSRPRMQRVVNDIIFDFSVKPRLFNKGNAILVASTIYEACKYYVLFQQETSFKGQFALVTSYEPQPKRGTHEETGAHSSTDKQFIHSTYTEILKNVQAIPNQSKAETYEDQSKKAFNEEPANMKLLIVVNKLLTGFDAPSCTYIYLDKHMEDHGLFQAICRTNRLDGPDKDFGYIVDYKDLFKKVEKAISVYSSELDPCPDGTDSQIILQDRLTKGKERLDQAIEALALLCEPVEPPKGELEHFHYFCGNTEKPTDLIERELLRNNLYKSVASLVRAYSNIADGLQAAGYSSTDIDRIREQVNRYIELREIIRYASNENLDLKAYEADMRHLLDTHIQASEPRKVSPFDDISLLDLIVKSGIADAINQLPESIKNNPEAAAETVENNTRSKIMKERVTDPEFFDRMSVLLDEIIRDRKSKAIEYEEYLKRIAELVRSVNNAKTDETPPSLKTPGQRALYNNMGKNEELAHEVDQAVRHARPDGWRGERAKELIIKRAIFDQVKDENEVERLFLIIREHREY